MPRANRFFIPGHIYHLTHRCHDRNFLLKFDKDKKVWLHWLFEAKSRFQLSILNYVVTSNHIHLLVLDTGKEVISNSIKLIASASAQNFNNRKIRKGENWEDRYHATAIQNHLQCPVPCIFAGKIKKCHPNFRVSQDV